MTTGFAGFVVGEKMNGSFKVGGICPKCGYANLEITIHRKERKTIIECPSCHTKLEVTAERYLCHVKIANRRQNMKKRAERDLSTGGDLIPPASTEESKEQQTLF